MSSNPASIVLVRWVDSRRVCPGWEYTEDARKELNAERLAVDSVGYLLDEDEKTVTIVQSVGVGQVVGGITIPRCSIKSIQYFKEPKQSAKKKG